MTKWKPRLTIALAAVALAVLLCAGCGSKEAEQNQAPAAAAEQPASEHSAAEHPAAEHLAGEAVAVHDCAGTCGMTNVPEDQLTEIDGKWYCAGCAKKVQAEKTGHGNG